MTPQASDGLSRVKDGRRAMPGNVAFVALVIAVIAAPFFLYPVFLMKVLCFGLFACAFNLLFGYGGLLSFGQAAFFGMASYVCAYVSKSWGVTPEIAILLAHSRPPFWEWLSVPSQSGAKASTSP